METEWWSGPRCLRSCSCQAAAASARSCARGRCLEATLPSPPAASPLNKRHHDPLSLSHFHFANLEPPADASLWRTSSNPLSDVAGVWYWSEGPLVHTVQVEESVWTVHLKSVLHKNCAENFNVIQQTDLNMSFAEYLSGVNFLTSWEFT